MISKQKIALGIFFLLLGISAYHWPILHAEKKTEPAHKFNPLKIMKSSWTETTKKESNRNTEPPDLDEDSKFTLKHTRTFWKREDFPHEIDFFFTPFRVPPRLGELENYPCLDCHEDAEINKPTERKLNDEHDKIKLEHGGKRFWCPTCHLLSNMNFLRSLKNQEIHFNRSYLICGQCHFQRQKDWFVGGHGKRIGNWKGDRVILVCTECHNPHSPAIKPKKPDPPPKRHHGPYNIITEFFKIFK